MFIKIISVLWFLLAGTSAEAANFLNYRISFQGLLQQNSGVAVPDGTYNAQFKIHTGGVADVAVWTKSPVSIILQNGIFTTTLSGTDNANVNLVPSLLDVSGSDNTASLQIDVSIDFTGGTTYSSTFTNIPVQAVPTAMLAGTCMLAKSVAASSVTAAGLTPGDYSTALTSGTYSINISGTAAIATTAKALTGGVSVPVATNISYAGSSGNFDQSGSNGTFASGTGAVSLNGSTSLASGKSFSFSGGASNFDQSSSSGTFATGTGAVSLNGAVNLAANKGITAAAGTGALDFSSATGVFKTSTGSVSIGGPVVTSITAQSGINSGYTSGGSANAQTIALSPALTTLSTGQTVIFKAGFTNTGATTLQVNSLTATSVKYQGQALTGGEIISGNSYSVFYDGTSYQILSPIRLAGSGTLSTVTLAANTTATNATTVTVAGAVAGDVCKCTPGAAPTAGYNWNCFTGAGVVSVVQSCANGASACAAWTTPSFKCQVFK